MDKRIRDLFAKKMRLILSQRKDEVAKAVEQERVKFSMRGISGSSPEFHSIQKVYEEKYNEICNTAWSELHRIAVTIGVEPDESLVEQLTDVFDEVLKPIADSYLSTIRRVSPSNHSLAGDMAAVAEADFSRSRELIGTEIELFSSNTAMMMSSSNHGTHIQQYNTFSGTIGAIQQGNHSIAMTTQNVDTAGLDAFRSTIESLLDKFSDHNQLAPLIAELKAEANKPQPQFSSIRGILSGIKAFIGLIKDGREIFKAVEDAALACGMDKLTSIPC